MNREIFMKELEYLLQDIPEEDKADALDYYRDYLEEAGEENEEAVIKEFGSPERIAAIIRSDLTGNLEEGGEFTENGYQDERFRDPNYQMTQRYDLPEVQSSTQDYSTKPERNSHSGMNQVLKVILWIVLICVAAPAALGIGGGILGVVSGLAAAFLTIIVLVGVITLVLFIGAIACGVGAVILLFSNPAAAFLFLGIAVLLAGLTLLSVVVCILFYGKFLPFLFRSVTDGISRLVHRGIKR
ncbi:DUF1700 domain-containing protein [Clostridium sp. MCC353]|nr:DUF1700 domain-containing protein [Clostridium sp. MCC353]MBT9779971.1 DUF1700 domain-containing protein [Clostridium sp. MCC353]